MYHTGEVPSLLCPPFFSDFHYYSLNAAEKKNGEDHAGGMGMENQDNGGKCPPLC